MLHVHAIHANEAMTEIIEAHPELRTAISGLEFPCVGPEAEIAFDFNCISIAEPMDLPPGQATRHINPIVRTERGMTDAKLRGIARVKPGQHNFAHVCPAIAVCILEIKDVWSARDQKTTAPWHDSVWKSEAVGEDGPFVVTSVAVCIFEQRNNSCGRFARTRPCRVAPIFHDKQSPGFIKSHCDRIEDNWLSGH